MKNVLKTDILGNDFKNPVTISSGCFGFGLDYKDYFNANDLGTFTLKGLTMEPRDGNYGNRISETSSGVLNCVGLENPGIDRFEKINLKGIRQMINIPITANINGSTVNDYIELTKRINIIDEITLLEINVSCPNVKDGGMAFGANPDMLRQVVREVRKVAKKPFVVKLSPNVTDIVYLAKIVEEEGADGISMINTLLGMSIDINRKKPLLGNVFGGLSGAAVKPIALRMIYQVSNVVSIPIMGMGGIASVNDALEFIMAGASMVSVGTHIFSNPLLPLEIISGLEKYCENNNISNISDIIGIAHLDDGAGYRERLKKHK